MTGQSIDEVRADGWLLFGPFETSAVGVRAIPDALAGADWSSVLESWVTILDAVFVATLAILFNISGSELVLDRDLDTNQEPVTPVLNVASARSAGSRLPRALAHGVAAVPEGGRSGRRSDRGGGSAGGRRLRRWSLGRSRDDRRGVPDLHRARLGRVGLGQAEGPAPTRVRVVVAILAGIIVWGFREGVVIGLVLAGDAVRDQLRPDRAGP